MMIFFLIKFFISGFFHTFAVIKPKTMNREAFEACLERQADIISKIKQSAHELHHSVNQSYGEGLPYSYHLDMVVSGICEFGHLVCISEDDVLPMLFGGYYHDSIEDARLTYNDVMHRARLLMTEEQALMGTEIVYALTNEKGRTRAERANENYYQGIRKTPYAPFIKLCDRLANITFSCSNMDSANNHMKEVYKEEMGHFLKSVHSDSEDIRLSIPQEVIYRVAECLIDDLECEEKNLNGSFGTMFE